MRYSEHLFLIEGYFFLNEELWRVRYYFCSLCTGRKNVFVFSYVPYAIEPRGYLLLTDGEIK
jgi:hypothetical protein